VDTLYDMGEKAMSQLEQIEKKYNIKYPELYKKLFKDGMLDWGKFGSNWHATYWEKFKANPPLLLFADIEIPDFARIVEQIDEIKDPTDYRKIKSEFQFIPFANINGCDLYVFQFDRQQGEDVPITLLPHDFERATILTKNLQDFIFRMMLESVLWVDDDPEMTRFDDLKLNLHNMLRTHKSYLTERQFAKVGEIFNRDLFEYKIKYPNGREESAKGLISEDELKEVLQQEIGVDSFDEEFVYMG
jgi:hypothetical protein